MSAIRVSVIVPAHNARETIAESLASLTSQALRDIEVVVIDDGSTDDTAAIADSIASAASIEIRTVSQPHGGRAAARNRGLDESRGEFIGFVDADDRAEPGMFEALLGRADTTGADLVLGEYVSFDADTGTTINHYREGDSAQYGASLRERPRMLMDVGASVCNKLYRRDLFARAGIRFPEGMDFEDLATSYRLACEAGRIEKVDRIVYHYRQGHDSSIMSARDERYLQIPAALEITNRHFADTGMFDELNAELEAVDFVHLILGRYADLFRTGSPDVRHRFIDAAFAHLDTAFPRWRRSPLIRELCGRPAKHLVSTHRPLLRLYTDSTAERAR